LPISQPLLKGTLTHIGQMAALVDVDGMSHQDAAAAWLADSGLVL